MPLRARDEPERRNWPVPREGGGTLGLRDPPIPVALLRSVFLPARSTHLPYWALTSALSAPPAAPTARCNLIPALTGPLTPRPTGPFAFKRPACPQPSRSSEAAES